MKTWTKTHNTLTGDNEESLVWEQMSSLGIEARFLLSKLSSLLEKH